MISLLGIAFDRGSQMVFKGHFYFSFGGINNIVKFDLLHCMLFVSLTVSFNWFHIKANLFSNMSLPCEKVPLRNIKCNSLINLHNRLSVAL